MSAVRRQEDARLNSLGLQLYPVSYTQLDVYKRQEHDIKPGTFYNWVKRLRQKGCVDFPASPGRSYRAPESQEVVRVDFHDTDPLPYEPVSYTHLLPELLLLQFPNMKNSIKIIDYNLF